MLLRGAEDTVHHRVVEGATSEQGHSVCRQETARKRTDVAAYPPRAERPSYAQRLGAEAAG